MAKERDETLFDTRTLELNLREGKINSKDYDSFLKSLPNSESNAEYFEITEEETSSSEDTMPEGQLVFSIEEKQ